MATYTFPSRSLPCDDRWDVIVVGGGPSGCTAAIAAAREGARTLLIEAMGCLGGMGTSGLVQAWCPMTDRTQIIYRGLAERIYRAARAGVPHVPAEQHDWVPINAEYLKRVYDEMVTAAGVTVRFLTTLAGVEMTDDGTVAALLVANKAGLTALKAKVYVDCTGDGDLAAWAGAEFTQGDTESGEVQPATHCFILSNIDQYAVTYGKTAIGATPQQGLEIIAESKQYSFIKDAHLCTALLGPSTAGFNAGHLWDVDNTRPASISQALMDGRQLAAQLRDALAAIHPAAYSNAFLAATGALLGIRETRRILGDYVLTLDDYLARRSFPDEICRNAYPSDIHCAKKEIDASLAGEVEAMTRYERYQPGESHGIPYRCLTPRGVRNVLVAGRCISTDRPVQGSTRVMPVCLAMGEAAGLAAALAAGGTNDVHAVDVRALRARLKAEGAYLP
jgi:hypothetical protein